MQKIINVLALLSFLGTSAIIGGGTYVFLNKDTYIENAKSNITKLVGEAIIDALPTALDAELPTALPTTTGGVVGGSAGMGAGVGFPGNAAPF